MPDPARPPVLVVDDNHDNTEIISRYLGIRGYPVTVAHDGDEALAIFERERQRLVLLDVMMPGRDGWEVCRLMKQHPALGKRVRVIMVTALDEWDDKRQALQTGADDYVTKPFDLPKLAAAVDRNAALVADPVDAGPVDAGAADAGAADAGAADAGAADAGAADAAA